MGIASATVKTVLITGGSSGIGYGLTRKFAAEGWRILWVSKPEEELKSAKAKLTEEYPNVDIHTLALDLANDTAAQELYAWASSISDVNVLVNNAGFGTYGYCHEIDIQKEVDMIHLNVVNLYLCTRYFLKDMIHRDEGVIINISSNSSFEAIPRLLTYSSTKAFVKHFSRGLSEEMRMIGSKVKVITICPAAISDTNFKNAGSMSKVNTFHKGLATTTTKEVVHDIWSAYKNGKSFQISGRKMRWAYLLSNFLPFRLKMMLAQKETSES